MKIAALIMTFTGENAFDECWNFVHKEELDAICVMVEEEEKDERNTYTE